MTTVVRLTVLAVLTQLTGLCFAVTTTINETWVASTVDSAAINNSSLRREVYADLTPFRCFSLATQLIWPFLTCYDSNKVCTLWELGALTVGGAVIDTSKTQDNICKIPFGLIGCPRSGAATLALGANATNIVCPNLMDTCTEAGIVTIDTAATVLPPTLTSCVAPFSQKSIGCILVQPLQYTWCIARAYCINIGGDLLSVDTEAGFAAMQQYMTANHQAPPPGKIYYLGVKYQNGEWQWIGSGRNPSAASTPEWATSQPSGSVNTEACAVVDLDLSYRMNDVSCTEEHKFVCEVKF